MIKQVVCLAVFGAMLAGCQDEQKKATANVGASCSSPMAAQLIGEITTDAVEKRVRELNQGRSDSKRVDLGKVRALSKELTFEVQDVLTTKNDPNSTKKYCEAKLQIRVPTSTLDNAKFTREELALPTVQNMAEDSGFQVDLDKFTKKVSYSVQPTDDGQKLYLMLENAADVANLSMEIVLSASINAGRASSQLSVANAHPVESVPPVPAVIETPAPVEVSEFDQVANEYQALEKEINVIWRALPKEVRDANMDVQRAFNNEKEATCFQEASEAKVGTFEQIKNACWSRYYRLRIPQLKALGSKA